MSEKCGERRDRIPGSAEYWRIMKRSDGQLSGMELWVHETEWIMMSMTRLCMRL